MKKTTRKTWIRKLDKLWREIIKKRSAGYCELCAKPGTDCHHIEHKSPQILRWNLDNGIYLCFRCHRLGMHHPASSVQMSFRKQLIAMLGQKQMDELKRMRHALRKYSLKDLEELYSQLKSQLT